ncbi:hypothetical protein BAQ48_25730 [Bacillus luti]|nr:hypothetical protein BAQ48_25730 [Bacillus luti]
MKNLYDSNFIFCEGNPIQSLLEKIHIQIKKRVITIVIVNINFFLDFLYEGEQNGKKGRGDDDGRVRIRAV